MIFNIGNSNFEILNVHKFTRTDDIPSKKCFGRDISVLSCRTYGHSKITTDDGSIYIPDTTHYLLCPPHVSYFQKYYSEELIVIELNFTLNPPNKLELIYYPLSDIKVCFEKLYKTWTHRNPGYLIKCKSIIYDIFHKLYTENYTTNNLKIKSSMDYLYTHYNDINFDIQEMINASNISPAYFRRIFKKQFNCTIIEYLNKIRIEHAKSLLESRNLSSKEISYICGYSDEKYFYSMFKKTTGLTTKQYSNR